MSHNVLLLFDKRLNLHFQSIFLFCKICVLCVRIENQNRETRDLYISVPRCVLSSKPRLNIISVLFQPVIILTIVVFSFIHNQKMN